MNTILGISAGTHDAAVAVIHNGDILFAGHAERYSGIKNDPNLNDELLLDATKSLPKYNYFEAVAYYERPWARYIRQVYTGEKFIPSEQDWSVKPLLDEKMSKLPVKYFNHHLSHAASSFQTSPFNEATCIVIDAIGEFDCITIWDASYNNSGEAIYKKVYSKSYPNSIGLMYSAVTARLGMRPMDEEYIVMGMAAYGEPKYLYAFREVVDDNLNFKHNFHAGLPEDFLPDADPNDLAASVQAITEELISDVNSLAYEHGRSHNICYSGGVALNCVANSMLISHCDKLWIMPNPGDAGAALGAAALTYKRKIKWRGPYLGHNLGEGFYPVDKIIKELLANQIVGVAHGKAEFGPRALGNRSLFADPRGADIKDRVNKIKQRQEFRPFAPVITEEQSEYYFLFPSRCFTTPYMQYTAHCLYHEEYPAIVHEDLSSRVQTVSMEQHPGLYQLLTAWQEETGCPMLLNTSLNIRGRPMVNDRIQADAFEKEYGVKVIT